LSFGQYPLSPETRPRQDANERLRAVAEHTTADSRLVPFLCKCADDAYFGRIEMTVDDYYVAH
jgi:hypothetical protein